MGNVTQTSQTDMGPGPSRRPFLWLETASHAYGLYKISGDTDRSLSWAESLTRRLQDPNFSPLTLWECRQLF